MPDRGKQFEYAVIIAAYRRIDVLPADLKPAYASLRVQKPLIEKGVFAVADKLVGDLSKSISGAQAKQTFYKSFKQLGGGAGGGGEPKTDVLFVKGGKKHRCSLKWGDAWQLSSAGVATTVSQLTAVLNNTKNRLGSGMDNKTIQDISKFLVELNDAFGDLPKKIEQHKIKKLLDSNAHLQDKFQRLLGSRATPNVVANGYQQFKLNVIEEMLTGKLTFKNNDKTADWILVGGTSQDGLRKIDSRLIAEVASKTYVRLRLKGRGKSDTGIRLNELVVTIEPKT